LIKAEHYTKESPGAVEKGVEESACQQSLESALNAGHAIQSANDAIKTPRAFIRLKC
jgi:hypothetical protein